MDLFLTDVQFGSLAGLAGVTITAIPAILAAYYARGAKKDSAEAKENSVEAKVDSAQAKESAARVAYEVMPNGGMDSPVPNLNDHVQYHTELLEKLLPRLITVEDGLSAHLRQADVMFQAVAEMYLEKHGKLPKQSGDDQ